MAKKKKKKSRKGPEKKLSLEALEARAREALEAGKYRRAKDDFKELCRHDKSKYLPDLLEAYEKLALEMAEKGRAREPESLVEQIEALTGAPASSLLRMRLSLLQEDFATAAAAAMACLQKGDGAGDEDVQTADAMVLGFCEIPSEEGSSILSLELAAVHKALERVTGEQYDEALAELKSVGLRSPFAHWRLFVKGLCAFYRCEDEKARKAFERLPIDSVPERAARPYVLLAAGRAGLEKSRNKNEVLAQACKIAGRESYGEVLPRAEYLWRVGRHRDSYAFVSDRLPGFPTEEPGLAHTLSAFYLNSLLQMDEERADKYLSFLIKAAYKRKKNVLERMMIERVAGLFGEKGILDDREVMQVWEDFMRDYARLHGENPRLRARVYAHLGEHFSTEEEAPEEWFFCSRDRNRRAVLWNEALAEKCFEESVRLEPGDRDVHFSQLLLYEKAGKKAAFNRKLDEIIRLFPEDKEALYRAGLGCLERNALQKGMKYLERAHELDPLDAQVRESLVIAYMKSALKHAQKSQTERYRDLLPKALEMGVADSDDYNRGHAYQYARWAAFELLNDHKDEARKMMDRAREVCRDELKLVYFQWLIAKAYRVPARRLEAVKERIKREFSGKASSKKASIFVDVLTYLSLVPSFKDFSSQVEAVLDYACKAVKQDCARHEAGSIVNFVLFHSSRLDVAEKYIDKMLRKDPEDPLFLFQRFQVHKLDNPAAMLSRRDLDELIRIRSLAEKQKDATLVSALDRSIREFERTLSDLEANPWYNALHEESDLGEDFEDDEDEDWLEDELFPLPRPKKGKASKRRDKERDEASRAVQRNLFDDM